MHVPFQLRLPISDATDMDTVLTRLRTAHIVEIGKLEKKLKANPTDAVLKEQATLNERGRRISIQGLIRLVVKRGIEAVKDCDTDKLLADLAGDRIVRGRTRG